MLKLSAYLPSLEEHDDLPSPLMDGDAVPAVVAPIAEINQDVLPGDDLGDVAILPTPVEDVVVLPPHLDPTPMQPLEGEVIQEEIIADQLDTEASQLMGAQIAMESYTKLLRSSGKNMSRQSAAFMAVGMRRATRLLPGLSIGLEDETSGTQVMAMQQANVDEKGLGAKISEAAAKIWAWIKEKFAKLAAGLRALWDRKNKADNTASITYLLAASKAVESGNPAAVKGVEAPGGLNVSQVLDAIHGEDVRAPKAGKKVKLPAKFAQFLTKDGKLDLNLTVEHEVRTKVLVDYLNKGTEFANGIVEIFKRGGKDLTGEQVADEGSDLMKKILGGQAQSWQMHGMTVSLNAEGIMEMEEVPADGDIEVEVPSPQEIRRYLEDIKKVLDSDVPGGEAAAEAFLKAGENIMRFGDVAEKDIPKENLKGIEQALSKLLSGKTFDSAMLKVGQYLDKMSTVAVKACDFFLSALLGKDNTISQEDFERLPSKGLSVIAQPAGPGMMARAGQMAKDAWRKLREFFQRLWDQFTAWAQKLWAKIRGTEADTDVLLLTNQAAPDDAGGAPGNIPQLPTSTRMKSVQAVRMLGGPAAAAPSAPEPIVPAAPLAPVSSVPAGSVVVPESLEIMIGNTIEVEPVWEEQMLDWLLRHYIPTQEKIVRDLTSWAGTSNFDGGIVEWHALVERSTNQLWQGMPVDNVPGQRTIAPGKGCKIQVRQEGMLGEAPVLKALKRRQIDQALARQKKLLKGAAGIEKFRINAERQRAALNAILDKRVAAGAEEYAVTQFYNNLETNIIVSSSATIVGVITKMCDARNAVFDAMIAARAKK